MNENTVKRTVIGTLLAATAGFVQAAEPKDIKEFPSEPERLAYCFNQTTVATFGGENPNLKVEHGLDGLIHKAVETVPNPEGGMPLSHTVISTQRHPGGSVFFDVKAFKGLGQSFLSVDFQPGTAAGVKTLQAAQGFFMASPGGVSDPGDTMGRVKQAQSALVECMASTKVVPPTPGK